MNLIATAKSFDAGRKAFRQVTEDEMELFIALLKEGVTPKPCQLALGRTFTYFYNWVRRCTMQLYDQKALNIQRINRPIISWKAKTYDDYKRIHEHVKQRV
jgi:hypothetical protein